MTVNADPAKLRQFSKDLRRFEEQVKAETRRLRGAFSRIEWNDSEGRRFEQSLDSMLKALDRAAAASPSLNQTLNRKAESLERYKGG